MQDTHDSMAGSAATGENTATVKNKSADASMAHTARRETDELIFLQVNIPVPPYVCEVIIHYTAGREII
jgi:hypothetical protein